MSNLKTGNPAAASVSLDFQLSKLSSVINGLNRGAKAIRSHLSAASGAVKSGTYQVDPLQLSQRIVSDCLRRN